MCVLHRESWMSRVVAREAGGSGAVSCVTSRSTLLAAEPVTAVVCNRRKSRHGVPPAITTIIAASFRLLRCCGGCQCHHWSALLHHIQSAHLHAEAFQFESSNWTGVLLPRTRHIQMAQFRRRTVLHGGWWWWICAAVPRSSAPRLVEPRLAAQLCMKAAQFLFCCYF